MSDTFKIFIGRLQDDQVEEIDETLSPDFLDIHEKDLKFDEPITIKGKAYLASEELIIQLNIHAAAIIPCKICNKPVRVILDLNQTYITVPVENIRSSLYDYADKLREAILLEVPPYVECEGNCPERKATKKYFGKENQPEDGSTHPFKNFLLEE